MPTVNFETTRATLCLAKMGKGCSERFIIPVHRVLSSEWKNFCGGRLDLKTLVKLPSTAPPTTLRGDVFLLKKK